MPKQAWCIARIRRWPIALEGEGRAVVRWKERNLYFGGVSAVEVQVGRVLAPPVTCAVAEQASSRDVDFKVRPADPSDAEALTRLAEAVSAEPEGVADLRERRVAQRRR